MPNVLVGTTGVKNGTIKAKWSAAEGGVHKTGSITYVVIGETVTTNEDSIRATAGIPQLYTEINGMWCQDIDAEVQGPAEHPDTKVPSRIWYVTCAFDSNLDVSQSDPDPLNRPARISRITEYEIGRLTYDANTGNPVVTANGEPIDIKRQIPIFVYSIKLFRAYPYSDAEWRTLANGVNATAWRGYPKGTAAIKVNTTTVTIDNTQYEDVTYTVKIRLDPDTPGREDTWQEVVPHRGFWYKLNAPSTTITNRDRDGALIRTPYNLQADGRILPPGDPIIHLPFDKFRHVTFPTDI